jgi:hypothetical protein
MFAAIDLPVKNGPPPTSKRSLRNENAKVYALTKNDTRSVMGSSGSLPRYWRMSPSYGHRILSSNDNWRKNLHYSLTGQSLSRAGKISSCVNWLSAREKIGPVNEPLTSQSTCLFNRFAPLFGEVKIGRLTEQNPSQV